MVAGQTDLYTLNSLNSFLQKRTPIPGGLSQATVLFNSFSLSFSKALLYSLKYNNFYLISYRSLLRDLPVEGSQVNIVLAEGNQCEKESFPVDGICVCCFRHLSALPSNPLSDDALHAVLEVVLLHPLDDGVHERVHHPRVALQHKTLVRYWEIFQFDTHRTVPLTPLEVKRQQVRLVEALVVPPGDDPDVPVVEVCPARDLGAQQEAGQVGGHGYPVEKVDEVPVDDGVELGQAGVGEAGVALLVQDGLQLPPEDEGGNVGDGYRGLSGRLESLQGVTQVTVRGAGPVVSQESHQGGHRQSLESWRMIIRSQYGQEVT